MLICIDLKQIESQLFVQEKWFIQDQQRTAIWRLQPQQATVHIPTWQEEESAFLEGEKEFGRAVAEKNPLEELRVKNRVTFHWLNYDSLSLAELLPGKKRKFFFFQWDATVVVGPRSSPSGLSFFNLSFSLLIFTLR